MNDFNLTLDYVCYILQLRREIRDKMRMRFEIVEVPRNISINDFCLAAVINLVKYNDPYTLPFPQLILF